MIQINLQPEDYNLADIITGMGVVALKYMPKTARAFKTASSFVRYTWMTLAQKTFKASTGQYARSIKVRMLTPFQHEIYTDHPIADILEHGAKRYDMKTTHPFGEKSRVVKKTVTRKGRIVRKEGDPYLVVPFRQGVPSARRNPMSESAYEHLRRMINSGEFDVSGIKASPKKSKKVEPNYKGELIPRATYNWGDRLRDSSLDKLEGLVAMKAPSGPIESRTQYMTFRVISVNSPAHKWIHPGIKAHDFMEKVRNIVKEPVEKMVTDALAKDLGLK